MKKIKILGICLVFLVILAFITLKTIYFPTETKPDYIITVKNNEINKDIIGLGWNYADARYLIDNKSIVENKIGKTLNEEEWNKYFDLLKWSGSDIIRHGFWVQIPSEGKGDTLYEPINDNNDSSDLNKGGFDFDSSLFDLHYKHLEAYKNRNITVFFTHWKNLAPWNAISEVPYPLAEKGGYTKETYEQYKNTWDDVLEQFLPVDNKEYSEGAVYLLKYLIEQKNFTNIKYFSMWNEPNFLEGDLGYNYKEEWWPMVKTFHEQMVNQGIHDSIKFVAPDSSGDEDVIPLMLDKYGEYFDVVADHDYYTRAKIISESPQLRNYETIINNISNHYNYEFPFIVAEYGNCGKDINEITDDEVYAASVSQAKTIIKHFKQGVKGLLRWQYSIADSPCYSAVETNKEYWFKPYPPVYYPHAVYARYVKPGMDVLKSETNKKGYQDVDVAVLKNEDDMTILLVNEADILQEVKIVFDELNVESFNALYVNSPESGIINAGKINVNYDDQPYIEVTLEKESIMTLTTFDSGDLNEPKVLSLRKD